MKIHTSTIENRHELRRFVNFPWLIYKDYPKWVPPLKIELYRKLNPQRGTFYQYGNARLYGAYDENNEMVGRIAAIYNPVHCEKYRDSVGFFGFFECIDSVEAAQQLINAAADYLQGFQCTYMMGPVSFTTNEEVGLLVAGYDESPRVMCNYAPTYYPSLLSSGRPSMKAMDLLSYEGVFNHIFPQKYMNVANRVSLKPSVRLRPFSRKQMLQDIAVLREIYNASFQDLWGFVPLSHGEAEALGKSLILFADDELVWIAEYEKTPVGFILAVPDLNEILRDLNGKLFPFGAVRLAVRRHSIKMIRVIALGVLPAYRSLGIETLLIRAVHDRIIARGYQGAEFSVVNENNVRMRRILERFGFRLSKRYRIYRLPIFLKETGVS